MDTTYIQISGLDLINIQFDNAMYNSNNIIKPCTNLDIDKSKTKNLIIDHINNIRMILF